MTEFTHPISPDIQQRLDIARAGDERINAVTRDRADIAHVIAHYIKTTYEYGYENEQKVGLVPEDDQWEIAKVVLQEGYDRANARAEIAYIALLEN